ncbi:hypothetical protein, partial [Streptococcus suis]|uniref:hypothetical protein n=1 Tax=Streptococcus suis TaxID=1307 RepID=UPI001EDD5605
RLIYHGLKIFKKSANRKRFQSRQDFGTFSIYLVIGRLQKIVQDKRNKKKNTDDSAGFHLKQLNLSVFFYLLASFCPASFPLTIILK